MLVCDFETKYDSLVTTVLLWFIQKQLLLLVSFFSVLYGPISLGESCLKTLMVAIL